jgi:hypothetical protein
MLTRRTLLASAAVVPLAGCGITINPTTGQVTLPANVVDFITSAVAFAAKYIPTAEAIAAVAASLFGPTFATIVTIGSQAINTVIQYLTNLITPLAPAAAARRLAVRVYSRLGVPPPVSGSVLIGYTSNGIPVFGYH